MTLFARFAQLSGSLPLLILGSASPVFGLFDRALTEMDETLIAAAMGSLDESPAALRGQVHDAVPGGVALDLL